MEGENRLTIAPMPGGSLKHACAEYISPYGKVVSRWEETDRGTVYTVEIPANVTAKIILPDGMEETVGAGVHVYGK